MPPEHARNSKANLTRRELGDQERLLHNVHRFGGLIGVQVMQLEGPVAIKTVRAALDWLQSRHPILQAHIKISGFGVSKEMPWCFLRRDFVTSQTQPIPLHVIENARAEDWQAQMQHQLSKPIRGAKMPRVRATLMRIKNQPEKNIILLATDHAIADAQAANMLTCQFLEFLGNPEAFSLENPMQDLPPALEQLTSPKSKSKSKTYLPAIRLPTPYSHPWERQTRVIKAELSQTQTQKISAALKENKTSMHGFLSASALMLLGETHRLKELTLLSNVEFRRSCSPQLPDQTFGCYIDIIRTKHRLDKTKWGLAQDIKFRLITTLARNQAGASQLKLPPLAFYRQEGWAALTSGMRLDAITVTTADAAAIKKQYGPIHLTDLTLAVSLGTIGANYFLISMEREGALALNLCYMHPGVREGQAQELLDKIVQDLNEL